MPKPDTWISVEEQLPPENRVVMWWSQWEGAPEIASSSRDPRAWCYTHWQPLPQPPEGEIAFYAVESPR